jgi:AraC-like DNA-binding protein
MGSFRNNRVSLEELSKLFSITPRTLYKLFAQGLPRDREKGRVKIDKEKAMQWLREQQDWYKAEVSREKKLRRLMGLPERPIRLDYYVSPLGPGPFITVKQCCKEFKIGRATLYRLFGRRLHKWKIGRATRIDFSEGCEEILRYKSELSEGRRKRMLWLRESLSAGWSYRAIKAIKEEEEEEEEEEEKL